MEAEEKAKLSRAVFFGLLSFLLGVAAGDFFYPFVFFLYLPPLLALILSAAGGKNWAMRTAILALALFALGGFLAVREKGKIEDVFEGTFQGRLKVADDPQRKGERQTIVFAPLEEKGSPVKEKLLVYAPVWKEAQYGDVFEVRCRLERPKSQDESFDYAVFLAKDGIFQVCRSAKLEARQQFDIREKKSFREIFFSWIFSGKKYLENRAERLFPYPESAFLQGLILGGSHRLDEEWQEKFRRAGVSHVTAVSGYNITVIAAALIVLGIWLGLWRNQAYWLALAAIGVFVLAIGAPASATRAAVMGTLVIWASRKGRLADSTRAVVLAAALMTFHSPLIFLHDAGFQLSVLATLGIVWLYRPLEEMTGERNFWGLRQILLVTVAAQAGVLGILTFTFRQFSPLSILANLVVLPLIPALTFLSFFGTAAFSLLPWLGRLIAGPTILLAKVELGLIDLFSRMPGGQLEIENVGALWLGGYYLLLVGVAVKLKRRGRKRPEETAEKEALL